MSPDACFSAIVPCHRGFIVELFEGVMAAVATVAKRRHINCPGRRGRRESNMVMGNKKKENSTYLDKTQCRSVASSKAMRVVLSMASTQISHISLQSGGGFELLLSKKRLPSNGKQGGWGGWKGGAESKTIKAPQKSVVLSPSGRTGSYMNSSRRKPIGCGGKDDASVKLGLLRLSCLAETCLHASSCAFLKL